MKFSRRIWILPMLALIFIIIAQPRNAYAYIDPGTGSYVLQLLLAALFGAVFTVKVFWTKIKQLLRQIRLLPGRESKGPDQ